MTGCAVLFVCTGNLYRSPIAERLFPVRLGPHASAFRVASAGTMARPGAPINPGAAELIRELGGDAAAFVAQRLTAELVASADVVLGLAREHREAAVRLHPAALRRCFSLEEFVRLADGERGADGPRDVVARAAAARGRTPPGPVGADDIVDPDGRPLEDLRACAARIDWSLRRVAALLMPHHDLFPNS